LKEKLEKFGLFNLESRKNLWYNSFRNYSLVEVDLEYAKLNENCSMKDINMFIKDEDDMLLMRIEDAVGFFVRAICRKEFIGVI